nr:hypothetical protein [Tanacetum cinerariifolium]
MTSLEDINDPTKAMNATLILFSKAFQLTAPTNNNQRTSSNPHNNQIAQPVINMSQDRQTQNVRGNGGNQFGQYAGQVALNQQGYNAWQNGGIQVARNAIQNAGGIQLQAEEFDFMAAAGDLDEIKENDNHVTSVASSMVQSGGIVETSSAPNEETRAHLETVYRNLVDQVAQENVSSNTVTASFTGLVHTSRTRGPQPKGNTRNARVPYVSKSSEVKKNVTVEEHRRTLLLPRIRKPSHLNVITLSLLSGMINMKLSVVLESNVWLLLIMIRVCFLL